MYLYNLTHTFSVRTIMKKKKSSYPDFSEELGVVVTTFFISDPFTFTLFFFNTLQFFSLFFSGRALTVHHSELSHHEVSFFFSHVTAWSWSYIALTVFCSPLNKINYVWIMNPGRAPVLVAYTRTWRYNGVTEQIRLEWMWINWCVELRHSQCNRFSGTRLSALSIYFILPF